MTTATDPIVNQFTERAHGCAIVPPLTPSNTVRASSPARIAILDHTAILGGGEIALLNFVRLLDRSKYDPVVILFSDGPLREKLAAANVACCVSPLSSSVADIRKDTLRARGFFKVPQLARCFIFALRLAAYLQAQRFDLIHTNSLKSDILGGLAGKIARIPVIWHVRDRIETDYLPKPAVRAFRILARIVPNCIIANSAATLETVHRSQDFHDKAHLTIDPEFPFARSGCVVHDGTPLGLGSKGKQESLHSVPIIGLIGRLAPWKGQHVFIQAAAEVLKRFPQCRFEIVGGALFGENEYEKEIRDLVDQLGISESVEFLGFRDDVSQLIAKFRIIVHASTSGEPFGQVIVEAMAAAKPVVATNGGGVPEIVIDGETGILIPMGDAPAMAQAICRLLEDESLADRMGAAGSLRAREHFSIEQTVKKIEHVYCSLLTRAAGVLQYD